MTDHLTERSYEKRAFTIDLADRIGGPGVETTGTPDVTSAADGTDAASDQATVSDIVRHDQGVSFLASGGAVSVHTVTVRADLDTTPAERIEARTRCR